MYLLDTNVLITASRQYYSQTIAPTFWKWLIKQHEKAKLASIHAVYKEITVGSGDFLEKWATNQTPKSFWIKPTNDDTQALNQLANWVSNRQNPKYSQAAISEFLDKADYFLIAQAKTIRATVVTFEKPEPKAIKRVLIPDACIARHVQFTDPYTMYEDLQLRFK